MEKSSQILLKKFEEGKQRNAQFSMRAFANKIGVSSGALSDILKGKRALTAAAKKKIADRLQLSPQEQIDFFNDELPSHLRSQKLEYARLSTDQFHLISDWWHYAILNLLKTKNFKPLPSWIAKRLNVPIKNIQDAWDRLYRLNFLERQNGKIVRKHPRIETNDGLFDLSIRKSHLEDLKLIEKSLIDGHVDERDTTSITFVINRKDLKRAKELIRIFQDQFISELEKPPGDDVYRMSVSLFPLSINSEEK